MKFTPAHKAMAMVIAFAFVLGAAWIRYHDFLSQGQRAPEAAVKLNEIEKSGIPDFSIESIDGKTLSLKNFAGKLIILNFWASWCDPCIAEFPSLMKLVGKFKGDIVLLAISADYEEADVTAFLKAFKVNDPNVYVAWDKGYTVANQFGTSRLPESYIIGPDGKLIRKVAGVDDWSTPEAYEYFEHLLNQKK
ncbi:MAG: TlpA family protein disulfide reductase [Bdellovibrionales bacterium]|nr:TlpA family protein disulfide reductase [Bdellovibrionales bacterium]